MPSETIAVVAPTTSPAKPIDAKSLIINMLEEAEAQEKTYAEKICAGIKAVGLAAKDLHYRAKGSAFYSEHLLADLAWNVEKLTDDFIEVFYMGDKGWTPPLMGQIYCTANSWLTEGDEAVEGQTTEYWAARLLRACKDVVEQIEVAKDVLNKKSGTQAVLDDISKQVLQVCGLLTQNLKV